MGLPKKYIARDSEEMKRLETAMKEFSKDYAIKSEGEIYVEAGINIGEYDFGVEIFTRLGRRILKVDSVISKPRGIVNSLENGLISMQIGNVRYNIHCSNEEERAKFDP